jgi:hypothetical protein
MSLMTWTRTAEPYCGSVVRVLVAAPQPVVSVVPTSEVRTVAPVNEVAVDGGRAATLVGETHGWEYLLVWSPHRVVVRASLSCDTQESNVVLAGNRFAHLCYQDKNYVVTGTIRPLRGKVALRAPGSAQVALAGEGALVAGSVDGVVWRFDPRTKKKLRSYPSRAIVVGVDGGRLLVDRPASLDVLTRTGSLVERLHRAHEGGAVMRGGRVATIEGRRLSVTAADGKSLLVRRVAPGAHLEDLDRGLVLYSVETQLHLLRLSDGRDIVLRLRDQFGYAHVRLWRGSIFYAYNQRTGRLGHAGYLAASAVRRLLRG